jgi:hypothetical protein
MLISFELLSLYFIPKKTHVLGFFPNSGIAFPHHHRAMERDTTNPCCVRLNMTKLCDTGLVLTMGEALSEE